MEIAELNLRCPPEVVRGFKETVGDPQYMVYKCGTRKEIDFGGVPVTHSGVIGVCTACGREIFFNRCDGGGCSQSPQLPGFIDTYGDEPKVVTDGQEMLCPVCGEKLTAMHSSHAGSRGKTAREGCASALVRCGDDAVVMAWRIRMTVTKDGRRYDACDFLEAYWPEKGKNGRLKLMKLKGWQRNYNGSVCIKEPTVPKRKETSMPETCYVHPAGYGVTDGTLLEKSGIAHYYSEGGSAPDRYLDTWIRHPTVENLEMNCHVLLDDILLGCAKMCGNMYAYYYVGEPDLKGFVNWSEVRPHLMLGMSRERMAEAVRDGWSCTDLAIYVSVRDELGEELGTGELRGRFVGEGRKAVCIMDRGDVDAIVKKLKEERIGLTLGRIIRYLQRQNEGRRYVHTRELLDTWRMIRARLGRVPDDLLLPRDLMAVHDREVLLYKQADIQKLDPQVHARFADLSAFSWEDRETGLCIRPAASAKELVEEGNSLHHCVSTYAQKVAAGQTSIFFIRKRSRRRESFFTLELNTEKMVVMQNRGMRNCERTPEVAAFEKKWLEYAKRVKFTNTKEKGNGKPNHQRVAGRAGA